MTTLLLHIYIPTMTNLLSLVDKYINVSSLQVQFVPPVVRSSRTCRTMTISAAETAAWFELQKRGPAARLVQFRGL